VGEAAGQLTKINGIDTLAPGSLSTLRLISRLRNEKEQRVSNQSMKVLNQEKSV
jgi:hypothetical protein